MWTKIKNVLTFVHSIKRKIDEKDKNLRIINGRFVIFNDLLSGRR